SDVCSSDLVGDVPFDAGNYNALLQIILGTPPSPPRTRGAHITNAVEQVMLAALEKDKRQRPPSARVLHELLVAACAQRDDMRLDTATLTFTTQPAVVTQPDASADASAPLRVPPPPRAAPTSAPVRPPSEPLRVPEPT